MVELMAAHNSPDERESEEAVQNKNGSELNPTAESLIRMAVLVKFFCLQSSLTNW